MASRTRLHRTLRYALARETTVLVFIIINFRIFAAKTDCNGKGWDSIHLRQSLSTSRPGRAGPMPSLFPIDARKIFALFGHANAEYGQNFANFDVCDEIAAVERQFAAMLMNGG